MLGRCGIYKAVSDFKMFMKEEGNYIDNCSFGVFHFQNPRQQPALFSQASAGPDVAVGSILYRCQRSLGHLQKRRSVSVYFSFCARNCNMLYSVSN